MPSKYKFQDRKVADLNIGHMPKQDYINAGDWVNSGETPLPIVAESEYAYMFLVPDKREAMDCYTEWMAVGYSAEFCDILTEIRKAGFHYAWFDCDGPIIKGLPIHEHD